MNIFRRLLLLFRKPKPQQPQPPVAAPYVPPVNDAVAAPAWRPPVAPQTEWTVHERTITLRDGVYFVSGTTLGFNTLAEATGCANALPTKAETDASNARLAQRLGTLQPGEVDVRTLTADDCELVCTFPHVFGGKVGPWSEVAKMINWSQCQGGEPVNAQIAARYPGHNSQAFAYMHWRGDWKDQYYGQLRPILDQFLASRGEP